MGFFDFGGTGSSDPNAGSDFSSGLMGMLANPKTAGMLGLAQGMLAASGPSRLPVSNGQALGMGLQGLQQGIGNGVQMQQSMLGMKLMQDAMSDGQQPQSAPSQPTGLLGLQANPSAGLLSPVLPNSVPQSMQAPATQGSAPLIFGRSPSQWAKLGLAMNLTGRPGGTQLMDMAAKYDPSLAFAMPTDVQKNFAATYGYGTPEYLDAMRSYAKKENYIAPTALRTPIFFNPQTGSTEVVPADQLEQGYGAQYRAESRAKGDYQLNQVWDPSANNGQGGYVYQTTTQAADAARGGAPGGQGVPGFTPFQNAVRQTESGGNIGAVSPKGAMGSMQTMPATAANPGFGVRPAANNTPEELQRVGADYATAMQQRYGNDADAAVAYNWGPDKADKWIAAGRPWKMLPDETKAYVGQVLTQQQNYSGKAPQQNGPRPMASQAPFGSEGFATGAVKQMQDRWGQLRDQNTSAQTVISQLQNISQLAPAAITGAEADRRAYANGLLSLAGLPSAENAKTATDLLDKYSNQIIAKLGQGGLGTDAARAIVAAGNPNSHMTVQAIQEAVRNLTGQYQMVQAKTGLLQQFANSNDAAGYTRAESQFDKNADPRIWEWQSIQDPAERQKFALKVSKQDPKFNQKIKTLEQLGAFQ